MEIEIGIPMAKIVSTSENKKNRQRVIDEWQLGPEKHRSSPERTRHIGPAWARRWA